MILRLFLAILLTSGWLRAADSFSVKADLNGDGKQEKVDFQVERSADGASTTILVNQGEQTLALNDLPAEFPEDPIEAVAVTPGEGSRQWIHLTIHGASDFNHHSFVLLRDGELGIGTTLEGQGKIAIPGNGSVVQHIWMGFWERTIKHVIGADDTLRELRPEFAHVGVKGKVIKPCEIFLHRDGAEAFAKPRVGSTVEVLLWSDGPSEGETGDWYLIKTESGFTGWMKLPPADCPLELPWAG